MPTPTRRVRIVLCVGLFVTLFLVFSHLNTCLRKVPFAIQHTFQDASRPGISTAPNEYASSSPQVTSQEPTIDWSSFAYVQYVTNTFYLCNSLMIFEALKRYNTKAELLMMYPQHWPVADQNDTNPQYESELLGKARDEYGVKLSPIEVRTYIKEDSTDHTWEDSYTKLLAFNQTQYRRVISLDSDATVLNHMDELFLLPSVPVAMPRAYWLDEFKLSSQLIVIESSATEWQRIEDAMEHHQDGDFDMDILHKMYGRSSLIIPHRKYDLLSSEFRTDKHEAYLGSADKKWDAHAVLDEAKLVHFSEWPLPKPWIEVTQETLDKYTPPCKNSTTETEVDCSDQQVWLGLRSNFTARRERICGHAFDIKDRPG